MLTTAQAHQQGKAIKTTEEMREYALKVFEEKVWEHKRGYVLRLLQTEQDVRAVMDVYSACCDKDQRLRFVGKCTQNTLNAERCRIQEEYITLVYERDGEIVGGAFLSVLGEPEHAEFAYVTHPDHRGNGLAPFATEILCTICHLLGIRYVHLETCGNNGPMHRVARKMGMVRQKTDPQEVNFILDLDRAA